MVREMWLIFQKWLNFSPTKIFRDIFSPIRYISGAHNSKSKCYFNAKPSAYYFYVKTKISVDFQICTSVLQLMYRNSGSSWILCLDYNFSRLLTQNVLCLRSIYVLCPWSCGNQIFWSLSLTFYFLPVGSFHRKDYPINSDDSNVIN